MSERIEEIIRALESDAEGRRRLRCALFDGVEPWSRIEGALAHLAESHERLAARVDRLVESQQALTESVRELGEDVRALARRQGSFAGWRGTIEGKF